MELSPSTRIGRLLATDAANVKHTPAMMADLSPWVVQAFEETADLFRRIIERLEDWPEENVDQAAFVANATALGLTPEDAFERLKKSALDASLVNLEPIWMRLGAYDAVRYLVLACQRYWAWAASDLFRLRLTPAVSYLRLEAESVGLCKVILEKPRLGRKWLSIRSDAEGQRFFGETKKGVRAACEMLQLQDVYEISSGSGQHVRFASIARALRVSHGGLSLPDQEFDSADPFSFHLAVAHFHRTQERVVAGLATTIPGGMAPDWVEPFRQFAQRVNELWRVLAARYPTEIKALTT